MGFAENLRDLRNKHNLSKKELAQKVSVPQLIVETWESGKNVPNIDELRRLATILRVTIGRLLIGKERKIEIIKNEIYIDGEKIEGIDPTDVEGIIKYIEFIKLRKGELPKRPPPSMSSTAKKILVIDDEQEVCEMLYTFLIPHNYKVFLAFNGQMGLEYFEEIKPDIVFLDLKMPDIDGVEVLRILRKVSSVPVIIITGHPQEVADIYLQDLRIEGYFEKPLSLQGILNTLKTAIGE